MKVTTNDLYCGAYLLSKGGRLAEIIMNHSHGRQSCLFVLTGADVLSLHQEFLSGAATVNLREFKASMLHLKDRMFSYLRQQEKGEEHYERQCRKRAHTGA